jgi:hypothetical protein
MGNGILGCFDPGRKPLPVNDAPRDTRTLAQRATDDEQFLQWIKRKAAEDNERRLVEGKRVETAHLLANALADDLEYETSRLCGSGLKKSTLKQYKHCYNKYREFCQLNGVPSLPSTPESIALYLLTRAGEGANKHALEQTVCALKHIHRLFGEGDRTSVRSCDLDAPIVRAAFRFTRRMSSEMKAKPTEKEK